MVVWLLRKKLQPEKLLINMTFFLKAMIQIDKKFSDDTVRNATVQFLALLSREYFEKVV